MLSDANPDLLIDVLRGDRSNRPDRDVTSAAGLRAMLEDSVFALIGPALRESPLIVTSAKLRRSRAPREISDSPLSRVRGVAIGTLLHLLVAQVHIDEPWEDVLRAWRVERPHDDVLVQVAHLDVEQVARLRADVRSHFETMARHVGSIASSWRPRTSLRAHQILAGGNVELRDVVDLMVGSTHSACASVVLLDVTTSPLGADAERVMRYHALVHTLRTCVVPLRTSIFSSATGELWALDVDTELLMRAVNDVNEALRRAVEVS